MVNELWDLNIKDKKEKVVYIEKPFYKNIPSENEIIESLIKYKDVTPEVQRPLNFNIVHSIKGVAKPLQQYIEKVDSNSTPDDDIILGGSAATWTQVKKFRRPHDLDLETAPQNMNNAKNHIVRILQSKYSANSITTRNLTIGTDNTKVIQILVKNRPVVDIKEHHSAGTLIYAHYGDIYYEIKTRAPIKIGRIYYTHISELFERKGKALLEGYHTAKKQGKEIPERTEKDFNDFISLGNSFNQNPKKNIKTNTKIKKTSNKNKHEYGFRDLKFWSF